MGKITREQRQAIRAANATRRQERRARKKEIKKVGVENFSIDGYHVGEYNERGINIDNPEKRYSRKNLPAPFYKTGLVDEKGSALLNQNKGYRSQSPIAKGCAKSEGGSGCVKKRGDEWVIENNKKPGNQVWRSGFSSKAQANNQLAAYHSNK